MENKVKVTICNNEYNFTTDDSVDYIKELGEELDKRLTEIVSGNSNVSVTYAAVFTALDYCDKAKKAAQDAESLRSQISTYLDDINNAQSQLRDARKEIDSLKSQVRSLQAKCAANK